ncbi:hypothetical protein [Pseudomonas entomophila]|nr:hypothetical protein [Pseudomonas entomophila]WMW03895.1 hypothetical protein RAH46_16315 [Pseudomonas entomophila]
MSENTLDPAGLKKIYDDLKRSHDNIRNKIDAEMENPPATRLPHDDLLKMSSDAGKIMVGANSAYDMYVANAIKDIQSSAKKVKDGIKDAADTIFSLQEAAKIIGIIASLVDIAAVIASSIQDWDNLGKLPELVRNLNKQIKAAKKPDVGQGGI